MCHPICTCATPHWCTPTNMPFPLLLTHHHHHPFCHMVRNKLAFIAKYRFFFSVWVSHGEQRKSSLIDSCFKFRKNKPTKVLWMSKHHLASVPERQGWSISEEQQIGGYCSDSDGQTTDKTQLYDCVVDGKDVRGLNQTGLSNEDIWQEFRLWWKISRSDACIHKFLSHEWQRQKFQNFQSTRAGRSLSDIYLLF